MKNSFGQIIIEVLAAVALFSVLAFSIAVIAKEIFLVSIQSQKKEKAIYLAQELMEAIRSIGEENFEKLKEGIYTLEFKEGQWELSNEKSSGEFSHQVSIKNRDDLGKIKEIKVEVFWQEPESQEKQSFSLSEFFTASKIFVLELNSLSYLKGIPEAWSASEYTVLLSIKPKDLSQLQQGSGIFASQDLSENPESQTYLQIEYNEGNYQLRLGEETFLVGPVLEKWSQLAIVRQGELLKIYYDGKETFSGALGSKEKQDFSIYLLGTCATKTKSFAGFYKNLIIFNRALSFEEISSLFSGKPISFEGLKLYWKMEEGEGGTVKDYSLFGVNGEIVGTPFWKKIQISSWREVGEF